MSLSGTIWKHRLCKSLKTLYHKEVFFFSFCPMTIFCRKYKHFKQFWNNFEILLLAVQQCRHERSVCEFNGAADSEIRRLHSSNADHSVPYEQRHHAVGLRADVPRKTDCTSFSGETFIEVCAWILGQAHFCVAVMAELKHWNMVVCFRLDMLCLCSCSAWYLLSNQRPGWCSSCWGDQHASALSWHCWVWAQWNGGHRWAVKRQSG